MRNWLKMLRKEKGYTQSEIANKMGISQNYYANIENGERQKDLDLSIAVKLADIFSVSPSQIVEEEQKLKLHQ